VKDSTHRSRLKVFGKNILDDFNESSDSILNSNSSELIGITLKINDQLYYLCFKEDDDGKKLYAEAVVQQLDQHNISQSEGGYRSIKKILTFVIKMLINQKVLGYTLDDNVHIRISGDGRNVDHHYSLVLYSGIEKYEYLQKALHQLIEELDDIDKNGFIDSIGQKWRITIYFSSDWKFLSICLGINNATANHFCPWCLCSKFDH
ncbi:7856_t:CDS:2, partial [Entrophospora sp. SA101]